MHLVPSWNSKLKAKESWCLAWFIPPVTHQSWKKQFLLNLLFESCQLVFFLNFWNLPTCFFIFWNLLKLVDHLPVMYFPRVGPPSWLTHYSSLKKKKDNRNIFKLVHITRDKKVFLKKQNPPYLVSRFLGWYLWSKSPNEVSKSGHYRILRKCAFCTKQWPKNHFRVAKSGFWREFSHIWGGTLYCKVISVFCFGNHFWPL